MYQTCLFCHSDLGKNDAIESFPVGRRLAFDAANGRLWVVCRKCERWNLTPLEERWEAIEDCERAFSATRLRVSTDNIGLARVKEGLELVRVGKPQRPEFAAWRYGDQFGRRRRRSLVYMAAVGGAGVGALVSGPILGLAIGGAFSTLNSVATFANMFQHHRVRARIPVPGVRRMAVVRQNSMDRIRIVSEGGGWHLRLPFDANILTGPGSREEATIKGDAAYRAVGKILTIRNEAGASAARVREAVSLVSQNHVSWLFAMASRHSARRDGRATRRRFAEGSGAGPLETALTELPAELLLALEIATHEDVERRAMEGELAMLEESWRQAEEIARIADDLLLPDSARAGQAELSESLARKDPH
jgi:hypothetical protein